MSTTVGRRKLTSETSFVSEGSGHGESESTSSGLGGHSMSMSDKLATHVAKRPYHYLAVTLIVCIGISLFGMLLGDFSVTVNNNGWQSRGTLISDRHSQFVLAYFGRNKLARDEDGSIWDDMIENVQPGWETATGRSRRLEAIDTVFRDEVEELSPRLQPFKTPFANDVHRELQESGSSVLSGCDISWYQMDAFKNRHLWASWEIKDLEGPNIMLNRNTFQDLCESEAKTQKFLEENGMCITCDTGSCIPPVSIVLFARFTVNDGLYLDCERLADEWGAYIVDHPELEENVYECMDYLLNDFDQARDGWDIPAICPERLSPTAVAKEYAPGHPMRQTTSIFATREGEYIEQMYKRYGELDKGTSRIQGTYDTLREDFVIKKLDNSVVGDMILALGSACITTAAIFVHTRSPFLSIMGILQILLSFPVSYFFYYFIAGITFFPFLNFIGIFVVFALGADDVFVAVDKWKNARIDLGSDVDVAEIAKRAMPDATLSMFLTTLTTAVAFFGSAVCYVAPVTCFAIFCGFLIVFDYLLCLFLIFPALCIYDRTRFRSSCFCNCFASPQRPSEAPMSEDPKNNSVEERTHSPFIRRILSKVYDVLHAGRYGLLAAIVVVFALSAFIARKMELPQTGDVRLLPKDSPYEVALRGRQAMLWDHVVNAAGGRMWVVWGLTPADTGNHINPETFTQLKLDETFEPSTNEAQIYLRDFLNNFSKTEYAKEHWQGRVFLDFQEWLGSQAVAPANATEEIYTDNCGGADGLPMAEDMFDACLHQWSLAKKNLFVLARNGKISVIMLKFTGRLTFESSFEENENEWQLLQDWFAEEANNAPAGVNKMYFTSDGLWWFDTNKNMLGTAYVAAAIAIATGAAVILFSSHSFILTLFAAFTICYVLVSVTAGLVILGWRWGFLESICFSILIGIACDFVIHFTHAYSSLPGGVDRHTRTKSALVNMGPSILAGAFTTFAAATIMLFTTIAFFVKFAMILFSTVLQATIGSFVVFLVIADVFGPSDPRYLVDNVIQMFFGTSDADLDDEEFLPFSDSISEIAHIPSIPEDDGRMESDGVVLSNEEGTENGVVVLEGDK